MKVATLDGRASRIRAQGKPRRGESKMTMSFTIETLTERIAEAPDDPQRHSQRALAYFHLRQPDLALADVDTAIRLAPDTSEHVLLRALIYFETLRFDLALADINRAIEMNPQQRRAYYYRGLIAPNTGGDIERVRPDLRRGIGSPVSDPEHHYGLAALVQCEGDYQTALRHTDAALAIEGDTLAASNFFEARTKALAGLHRIAESCAAYDRAIELYPESVHLRLSKAALKYDMAEWKDAADLAASALAIDPDRTDAYHLRAHALMNMGEKEEAIRTLRDGLDRNPSSEKLWRARADAYLEMERPDDAIETWAEMSERTGMSGLARIEQTRVHADAGRSEEAMRLLDEVADEPEADYRDEAYLTRADIRLQQGDLGAAMGDYAHVAEYGAGDVAELASIAGARLRWRMEYEEYSLHNALVGDEPDSEDGEPDSPAALVERAKMLYLYEDEEELARRMIRRALELEPDNEEALPLMIRTLELSALDLESKKAELDWMIRTTRRLLVPTICWPKSCTSRTEARRRLSLPPVESKLTRTTRL